MSGEVRKLYAGDARIANLSVNGGGFPWLEATVEARPGFDAFRPLFDQEWVATEAKDRDRADVLYREIANRLTLVDPEGTRVAEFLLHVQGEEAWWRWSYEPFED